MLGVPFARPFVFGVTVALVEVIGVGANKQFVLAPVVHHLQHLPRGHGVGTPPPPARARRSINRIHWIERKAPAVLRQPGPLD